MESKAKQGVRKCSDGVRQGLAGPVAEAGRSRRREDGGGSEEALRDAGGGRP